VQDKAKYLNRPAGPPRGSAPEFIPGARGAPADIGSEVAMSAINHPPKHLVREYLERRKREHEPPPTPEEIRRQLGWGMLMPQDLKVVTTRS
jgi:hypothetical protein